MKRVYWRPVGPSSGRLVALAVASVCLLLLVERWPFGGAARYVEEKKAAAALTERAFSALRAGRPSHGLPELEQVDRARTGLIGPAVSEITTSMGSLPAKRTAANPNFAAVIVEYLEEIGVERGQLLGVGCSGSFPSLNVAVLAAAETLGLEPLIVSSVAASNFGASAPSFTWLDMERLLVEQGLLHHRSLVASLGGVEDQGVGLTDRGRALLLEAIERNRVPLLDADDFDASLDRRMEAFDRAARGRPLVAYVNVGGGTVSVGRLAGKKTYKPGLNRPGLLAAPVDSILGRFLDRGVPVIHLTQIEQLARRHGLPIDPAEPQEPGVGAVFEARGPQRAVAFGALLLLGGATFALGWSARRRASAEARGGEGQGGPPGAVTDGSGGNDATVSVGRKSPGGELAPEEREKRRAMYED